MEEKFNNIVLLDENDNEVEFEHVLTFMYEDERYMALTPAEPDEDEEGVGIVFVKILKENGDDFLEPVVNEVMLDELFEVFCDLMDAEEGDEEEPDREDE